VPLGTTAEVPTLTASEKTEILRFVKSNNPKQLPVVLGIGSNGTEALKSNLSETDLDGVDAVLSVVPYYNRPTQAGLIAHFAAFANASPVPVILYNVPARSACNLEAQSTIELASHPNIIGIKEASANVDQCAVIASQMPNDFLLISGDDMSTLPLLSLGGSGVISVVANAIPRQMSEIVTDYLSGHADGTATRFHQLVNLTLLIFQEGNPAGVKEVLRQMGICDNAVRLPLISATDELAAKIKSELARIGI